MYTVYTLTSPKPIIDPPGHANTIAKNWYMFKVYSENLGLVKHYIQYINSIFGNAFDLLEIGITSYEVPEDVAFDSGYMSDYINHKYELTGDDMLTFEMHLIVEGEFNVVLGKYVEVMTNDFGYDDPTSCYTVFSSLGPGLVSTIAGLAKYFCDKEFSDLLLEFMASVWNIMRTRINSEFLFRATAEDLYESPLIHTPYMRILQLKYYVHDNGNNWLSSYGEGIDVNDGYICD